MNRRTALAAAAALTGMLASASCSAASGPDAEQTPRLKTGSAYVPQPVTGERAAGFLTVRNTGGADDRLTSVTSDVAGSVQLHKTADQRMQRVKSLTVPANGTLELSRGGNHLMLLDLKKKPVAGERITMELRFEKSDPVQLSVPVKPTNHDPDQ